MGYDTYMQFILNLGNTIVACFGACLGVALADRMPRRKVLVIGTFFCAVFLAINGALSARWAQLPDDGKNLSVGRAAVASYFLFGIVNTFTYTPLQAIYPVESLTTTARAKGECL